LTFVTEEVFLPIKMLNSKLTSVFICVLLKDALNDPEHVRGQTGSRKVKNSGKKNSPRDIGIHRMMVTGMFSWKERFKAIHLAITTGGLEFLSFRLLGSLLYMLSFGYVSSFAIRICLHATALF